MSLYFINFSSKTVSNHTHTFLKQCNSSQSRPACGCSEVCLGAEVAVNPVTIDYTFPVYINLLIIENLDISENKKINHTHGKLFCRNHCSFSFCFASFQSHCQA